MAGAGDAAGVERAGKAAIIAGGGDRGPARRARRDVIIAVQAGLLSNTRKHVGGLLELLANNLLQPALHALAQLCFYGWNQVVDHPLQQQLGL